MVVPGYRQKPEESAKAIKDGWLHTGDVAKMDVAIQFMGEARLTHFC
jgi:long-subunit acyl-CoA synthetase (AMP-forming)